MLKCAMILFAVLTISALTHADTIIVPDDYPTIQQAIDAAVNGDTVLVKPGTYVENIDFMGKAIVVMSEQSHDLTIIDGKMAGSVITFQTGEGQDSVLVGFTIKNGNTLVGGGIFCRHANPSIKNNIITFNEAQSGGGIYCQQASPIITNNIIFRNIAGNGGGIYCDEDSCPSIEYNNIARNTVISVMGDFGLGGGIYCYRSSPDIMNNIITLNRADKYGGGIYNFQCNPIVTDCTFSGNMTGLTGGGMSNHSSHPKVSNCLFTGNSVPGGGGGMYNTSSNPTVMACIFAENQACLGGGICNNWSSSPIVTDCTFRENWAHGVDGGGGMVTRGGDLTITDCSFTGNSANENGGGMSNLWCDSVVVTNCAFIENSANECGGGVYNIWCIITTVTSCTFTNNSAGNGGAICSYSTNPMMNACVFTENVARCGGGMYSIDHNGNSAVINCTFHGNLAHSYGGGIGHHQTQVTSAISTTISNTVSWNNSAPDGPEIWFGGTYSGYTLNISHSDVNGGLDSVHVDPSCTFNWGPDMIDSNPLFFDSANGDFHLTFNSPCRGSGDNSAVTELYDFEGDPRICQGTVDIGADEFYRHLYCTGDATPGNVVYGKLVGLPGTSPVCLLFGTGICDPPMPTMWGGCCLEGPILLVGFAPIPTNGVLSIPERVPTYPPPPYDIPMQALIGLNPDSLTNLCVLEVR